jgi:hypothetical protein
MVEVSVWAVRVGTIAAFAVGAGFGFSAREWWMRTRKPAAPAAPIERHLLH